MSGRAYSVRNNWRRSAQGTKHVARQSDNRAVLSHAEARDVGMSHRLPERVENAIALSSDSKSWVAVTSLENIGDRYWVSS